jgi:uncharacterized protein YjbJ (UPF0337 family)
MSMDKHSIAGSAKVAKGEVKKVIGNATRDVKLQAEGRRDKAEGKVQKAIGGLKDTFKRK